MKIIKIFFDKIFIPLIILFLTPIIVSIGSKVVTNNWISWFKAVPKFIWIILVVLIFIWIFSTLIYRRNKIIDETKNNVGSCVITIPYYGWVTVGKLNYNGVIWRFHVPAPGPLDSFRGKEILPNELEVDGRPRCPNCETELEENKSFWGGYIWSCVSCNFKKRNKNSYYNEEERALRIVRRQWEQKNF